MPGVYRSSINLTRWRGAVPNALNAGRIDAMLGTSAITDVQAGLAREATLNGVGGVVNTINTNVNGIAANGAQQATLTNVQSTVNGISANGAQQSTLGATQGTVNAIWDQITGAGVVVSPGSYVVTKSMQRGDIAVNNGNQEGYSTIGAVNPAKANVAWGGWFASSAAHEIYLYSTTLVRGYRGPTGGNDNARYEVAETP